MKKEMVMVLLDELYDSIFRMKENGEVDPNKILDAIYDLKLKIRKS